MASSDNSPTDTYQEPVNVVDELDETEEVDIIRKSKDILTKLESRFARIAKEIIRHFSKEFADSSLKSLIKCAICKEILIGTVSRGCMHSFCHHCLTDWFKRSTNCPICRDEGQLTVKNPLIDQFIDLVVDLTFSKEEKTERINLIQQRSIPSSGTTEENATLLLDIEHVADLDSSVDIDILSRKVCVSKAHSLLARIFGSDQFNQLLLLDDGDYDFDTQLYRQELIASFANDVESLESLLKLSPNP